MPTKKVIGCVQHDCPECQKRIAKEQRKKEANDARNCLTKMFREWNRVDEADDLEVLRFSAKWLTPSITGSDTWQM
jgi:hypothetical protein